MKQESCPTYAREHRLWWLGEVPVSLFAAVFIALMIMAGAPTVASSAPPLSVQQQATPAAAPDATVEVAALNLRGGPGTNYAVITVLRQGDVLDVIGQYQGCSWLQVRTGQGAEGWVSGAARFVTLHIACAEVPAATPSAATATPAAPPASTPVATPTPEASQRLPSGAILRDNRMGSGRGTLTVENLNPEDGVVALVLPVDTTHAVAAFYLRSGERFTLAPVPDGEYKLAFTKGYDWSVAHGEFTRGVQYRVFEDIFDFTTSSGQYTTWFATLHGVEGGTADAPPLPKQQFPDLRQS